ncbi:A/G-specific adenine glycosylase, partial [Porphyromonas loveana]
MINSPSRARSLSVDGQIEPQTYFPELRKLLADWYHAHKRDLPWRQTTDPYRIWISEVILQQTRVEQGRDYYHRFIERFPDAQSLAEATEDEVLKMWEGLGYYSRARNLHRAAQMVVSDFGGCIPRSQKEILQLPGIGDYTAAAILSFAFDLPYAAVDGNVFRVVSRLLHIDSPI